MTRSPAELEDIALAVAHEAGNLVMAGWRTRPPATKKGRVDLVTEFDVRAEDLIRRRLTEETPEIAVLAEERGGGSAGELLWCCDPLDGTTNFVHGHHFWAISIGVLKGPAPIAGAVVAPALRAFWTGRRGGPARRDGAPCRVSQTNDLGDALIATGFPYDRSHAPNDNFDSFIRVKRIARGVRRCGSAAIDLCLVADGTYDGYWERSLNSWDLAAGAAIVLAAGGRVTALDGDPVDLHAGNLIASNARVHDALRTAVS